MKIAYNGGVIFINPLGLGDIRDKLATAEDTDMVVMCFGCTDKDIPDNTLYKAYNAILTVKQVDILACIASCEFNVCNYRTHDIDKYVIVMIGKMLKWFMDIKWDNIDQLILSLAYYEHKVYIKYSQGKAVKVKTLQEVMAREECEKYNMIKKSACILVATKDVKKAVTEINLPKNMPVCFMVHKDDFKSEDKEGLPKHYMVMGYSHKFNYSTIHNEVINQHLKGLGYGFYILCNDDIVLQEDTIDRLIEPLVIDSDIGVVGARLDYPEGKIQHVGVRLDKKLGALHIDRGTNNKQTEEFYTTRLVTFALVAIRSSAFWKIRGFSQQFAYDFNDIDFCLRCKKNGVQVMYNPNAKAIHDESRTRKQFHKTSNKNELKLFKERHKDMIK